ncbi:MAG: rhodanese-like domain-containing protein [Rhodospirillales bacterium]|nr:rhodanese-like domain-containing protein [Rhodospirillales bacterium]
MQDRQQQPSLIEIDPATLNEWLSKNHVALIDVRERDEFEDEHIPGATLVPLSSFDPCLVAALSAGRRLVLHCLSGGRATKAATAFIAAGLPVPAMLRDGLLGWTGAGYGTQSIARAA